MPARSRAGVPWQIVGWGGAVVLLAAPFVAMQVDWSTMKCINFIVAEAAAALFGSGAHA